MSSGNDDFDDDVDVISLARQLAEYIHDRDLAQARRLVEKLTREERAAVTRLEFSDYDDDEEFEDGCTADDFKQTLLYRAVSSRQVEFVKFLLEECYADVEKGWAERTPLCQAVYDPLFKGTQIEVVIQLIDHGANVNATGIAQSTPVFLASDRGDLDLVRYLVDKGANIHLPDIYGQTCLMHSMHYTVMVTISQYLMEQGSSVNAVNYMGNSALHYAVKQMFQPTTSVKRIINLLLRHGADASIRNKFGDDALQTAALHGRPEIIDHLIDKLKPTPSRCADLYSLIAARYIDEYINLTGGMDLWKESVSIGMKTSRDAPTPDPNPVYNGAVEARDLESLEVIAGNEDALYMQALVCRQRILGSSHYETIHWLSNRALHYARESDSYQRGIDLYGYASALCDGTSLYPIRGVGLHEEFVRLLQEQEKNGGVRFDDAAAPLRMMVSMSKSDYVNDASILMSKILWRGVDVIDLMCRLKLSGVEARSLRRLVGALLQSGRKAADGSNVLHLAVADCLSGYISNAVLEELLEAGAAVDEPDPRGNTPLHDAVRYCAGVHAVTEGVSASARSVIDQLLTHGAHVDIRNDRGETAVDRLPASVDKMQYTTLQCLAARAIRQHGVEYRHVLPASLTRFVEQH